ncbi:MAG: penicillin-binding protein activator [Candidatus Polarisedimenticolaceae bacterium]|nr:penicillin-binding protein activator [Candidatus Polarisedimenticolaceae bacterium]
MAEHIPYGDRYPLLFGSLMLWLSILPALAEQPPPHSLIWPSDGEYSVAPPAGQNGYCHPDFRNRLISLAAAARVGIDSPERLALFGGWLNLIQGIDQESCTEPAAEAAIRAWQISHRSHPAALLFPELFGTAQQALNVGILLPLQGEIATLSHAILEGMTAVAQTDGMAITVIDSIELMQSGHLKKETHLLSGFDCIIGPLERERVEQFALSRPMLPVLTLNYLPADKPASSQLFQIALRPEDEAYAVADLAAEAGHTQGILLYTQAYPWSERMAAALLDRWEQYGGYLETYAIHAEQTDFSDILKAALQLSESELRHKKIEGLLGHLVKFQPRRRQDIEFIVMLVDQRLGRMLKPQFEFWYAGSLPVYSSSKLLRANSFTVNRDLDGVQLTLPPWVTVTDARMETDGEPTLEQSLHFLGASAIRIVQASRCLSNSALLLNPQLESTWVLDETTRRFHYRSRQAVIKNDHIHH